MVKHIHNINYFKPVRKLLRNNLTPEEVILWNHLKNSKSGFKFRRQHSIGNFIADFFCAEKRLIIELDGSQHLDHIEHDQEMTNYFESLGINVIRFWNNEVNTNINGVLMKIEEKLGQPHPLYESRPLLD
jgi:very-short-patch-repair endonuclease